MTERLSLPAHLPGGLDLPALRARIESGAVALDWSAVSGAEVGALLTLLAGVDMVAHADSLGLETVPSHLLAALEAAFEGRDELAEAPPAVKVPPTGSSVTLSKQQQAVVDHRGGHLQVIACAGSGKTESISRRMAALIAGGVKPESIVAFTFTEKSAAELKERVSRRVGELLGIEFLDRLGPMYVGTIHSYCFRLLQTHVPKYGNYDVLDENRHAGFLSREFRTLGLKALAPKHWAAIEEFQTAADVISNELIDADDVPGTLGECYRAYLAALDRYHFLTFGRLISLAVEELGDIGVFSLVHGPLTHLFVDEYQDVNPAQERLIQMLATEPVRLCVVGDDDQSIYQWRGADVRNILEFAHRHEGVTAHVLETNRRSRPGIITVANLFATSIQPRLEKTMAPDRSKGEAEVSTWFAETPADEAEQIAETIERLAKAGHSYRDIAVLYRSVRTSGPPLVEALDRRDIPYSCAGRTGLFLQPEAALFGQIHAWFADNEWQTAPFGPYQAVDVDAVVTGLQSHFRAGGTIKGMKKYLTDWKSDRLSGARTVSLVGDFYRLLNFLGAHLIDVETKAGAARFGSFARFSQLLADFEHVTRRGRYVEEESGREFRGGMDRGPQYVRQLANYLCHYAFRAYEDFEGEPAADLDAVQILTVHQAKGLEWPVVFIPALVSRRFPAARSGQPRAWPLPEAIFPPEARTRYEGSDAEERRLFYVAMTRARDALYLSCFEKQKNAAKPSPFLLEVAGKGLKRRKKLPLPAPPESSTTKEIPPLTLSFSEVASYDDCGYRYRLANSFGFEQELVQELGYGNAIHHVLRQLAERSRARGVVPSAAEADALVYDEFYAPFANRPSFEMMLNAARRLVGSYLNRWKSDLTRIWATERPFELHLADGILAGRADVILDGEAGTSNSLAIVDYKSSTDPRRAEVFALQLAVYAAAGRGEGLDVKAAYLHDLKEGDRNAVDVSPEAVKIATARVGKLAAGIRSGNFPPNPEVHRCSGCDFHRVCRHATAGAGR